MKKLLLIFSLLLFNTLVFAQNQMEKEYYVRLSHSKNNKAFFARMDDKVIFRKLNQKKKQKGILELITEQGVLIDDELIPLDSLEFLISTESRVNARLTAMSIIVGGGALNVFGVAMLANAKSAIKFAGVGLIVGGTSAMIYSVRKWLVTISLKRSKGWKLDLVKL